MSAAARVGDPIEHSAALEGLLLGLAVGAAAVVVAAAAGVSIVASGGLAAVTVVGAVITMSAGIGELIGSLSCSINKGGQIFKGSENVHTNGKPAARAHLDTTTCDKHGSAPQIIAEGSDTVFINGQPAARVGDHFVCDGKISSGSNNVNIGGGTKKTDDISPEVPFWLHMTLGVIGVGSAAILTTPAIAIAGLFGSVLGGVGGNVLDGRWFGEDSNGQKLMTFGGAFLGGGLAGKGRQWFDARYEIKTQGFGSNPGNVKITPREAKTSFVGKLRGEEVELPGVRTEEMIYTKRAPAEVKVLRNEFDSKVRGNYLKNLSEGSENITTLKNSGFTDAEVARMQAGKLPNEDWQVHHVKPLDDGGTNSYDNLVLIKNEPYHKVLTNAQRTLTGK